MDIGIPSLIQQPLVENAIRHGLMSSLRGGTVIVSIKKGANAIVSFTVEDNGCGMSETKREEILNPAVNKKGVGLWNISQRIKLLYGNSLHIESAEGIGTKVCFDIPT
ncbi:sensor histidine kinase [Cohnella sp. OV330]|uniref:sensor histidine kinase n=1 Tax=Cohnella sp. OV330 TaxID=1855288 RepID=UPI000B7FBDC5|nr:ATP-binding protein [Cohnella sp. OV330]